MVKLSYTREDNNTMLNIFLRKLLFDREMNQSDLQRKTGIRGATITAYYHGYISRMNKKDIEKMCVALNCKIEEFMEIIPDKK